MPVDLKALKESLQKKDGDVDLDSCDYIGRRFLCCCCCYIHQLLQALKENLQKKDGDVDLDSCDYIGMRFLCCCYIHGPYFINYCRLCSISRNLLHSR